MMKEQILREIAHSGVLGMKWGVHRTKSKSVSTTTPNPKSTTKQKEPPAEDYIQSRKLKSKGVKNLSNKELKDLTNRLQLEKQYKDLNPSDYKKGMNIVKGITAAGTTVASLYALSKTPMAQDLIKAVKVANSAQMKLKGF
jgi:hypothetical protein